MVWLDKPKSSSSFWQVRVQEERRHIPQEVQVEMLILELGHVR